jgi:digeranylgeranylglycerophospholipid reductase
MENRKLNPKYDVIIIGAGPVGIYTSIRLAKEGLGVLVIEEDLEIGKPRFCTGLISKEAFDKFSLPKEAIENEFYSAWVFSPLGSKVCLNSKKIKVYVTDRTRFDFGLYNRALDAGVKFLLNCFCRGIVLNNDYVQADIIFEGEPRTVRSEVVILSTGIKYHLHRNLGFAPPANFLDCSQIQLSGKAGEDIEIFLGNSVAPHSFAWLVPLKKEKLRIGISTRKDSPLFLKSFLNYLESKGYIGAEKADVIRRPIPLEPIKKTYNHRVLVVGDAAGQVKPTTGGGVYFGLLCADLAVQTVMKSFKEKDFSEKSLRHYEINWKKTIEFDLTMSIYLRKLLANFNDGQIEELVKFLSQKAVQQLIEKHADFNHHGRFIKELIKFPPFWKSFYQILATK